LGVFSRIHCVMLQIKYHCRGLRAAFLVWKWMMVQITLPDGSNRAFDGPVTVAEAAESIGPGLARAALAGRVVSKDSKELVDTSYLIEDDTTLEIVTAKDKDGLEVL